MFAAAAVSAAASAADVPPRQDGGKVLKAAGAAVLRGVGREAERRFVGEQGPLPIAPAPRAAKPSNPTSEAADRDATVLAIVAALDQVMLLNDRQREEVLRLVADRWQGQWRTPSTWRGLIHPRSVAWQTAMTRAAFGILEMDESELAPILRPAQLAVCHELNVYAAAVRHDNVIAPRKPQTLFELSLEDVVVACELSDEQRATFRLTGKSDVKRFLESADWETRHRRANEKDPAGLAMIAASLPAGMLPDDLPRYRKALGQWLTPEQRQKLAKGHQRRRQFERRAELASILRVIRGYARPTDSHCERLADCLAEQLGDTQVSDDVCIRVQLLAAVSRLSSDEVAGMVGADRGNFARLWKELRTELRALDPAGTITSSR